jgi:hypothetical protein
MYEYIKEMKSARRRGGGGCMLLLVSSIIIITADHTTRHDSIPRPWPAHGAPPEQEIKFPQCSAVPASNRRVCFLFTAYGSMMLDDMIDDCTYLCISGMAVCAMYK